MRTIVSQVSCDLSSAQFVLTQVSTALLAVFSLAGSQETRQDRSLTNTFPFSGRQAAPLRADRQTSPTDSVSFDQVAAARPNNDGKRCIDKVEMVEVIEYDDVVQCDHSYDKRCHTTYVTNYIRKVLLDVPIPGFKCFF